MKNRPLFLLGLFAAVLVSWAGFVLGSHGQLGTLTPFFDEADGQSHPARLPGLAARGQAVYADLGCAACHTQQVRRPGFGADQARGWGERQSVARDYIFHAQPQLGASRLGPDLMNLAGRKPQAPSADDLHRLLYTGSAAHPAFPFLYETRGIVGESSRHAVRLTGAAAPKAGSEVVATERAQTLVAYLLNVNSGFEYPEARPLPVKSPASPEAKK